MLRGISGDIIEKKYDNNDINNDTDDWIKMHRKRINKCMIMMMGMMMMMIKRMPVSIFSSFSSRQTNQLEFA